jgi:integrase
VQERLGHASPATTLRIYAHVTSQAQREASQVADRLLTPPAAEEAAHEDRS